MVDLHCDLLLGWRHLRVDPARRHRANPLPGAPLGWHADLPRLRAGGVSTVVLGLPAPVTSPRVGPAVAESMMLAGHAAMSRDGRAAIAPVGPGDLGVVFAIEGGHLVGHDLSVLGAWRALGLRLVGPAHLLPNLACHPNTRDAWSDEPLTPHGRHLVGALDAHGLVLDLAHMNRAGFDECLRIHEGPVVVSHTGFATAHELWRNVSADQARAVADRGGVVGIIFFPAFLRGRLRGSMQDVVRHVDAVVDAVGIDHVGIGTDMDGGITLPDPMRDVTDLVHLTEALLRRGYTPERCMAILGGNARRVLDLT